MKRSRLFVFLFIILLFFQLPFLYLSSKTVVFLDNQKSNYLIPALASTSVEFPDVFAFYYPWYGTPNVSGSWVHWADENHNPDIIINGRRQIAATDYPLLDVYDSNNETLIREHISMAKQAGIQGFIASWWGNGTFTDQALAHLRNVCEQEDFKFTIYYESALGIEATVNDIIYLLENYGTSDNWYRIDNRPVIYVYILAVNQLGFDDYWTLDGRPILWSLADINRDNSSREGLFIIHPPQNGTGHVESDFIYLPQGETFTLETAIGIFQDDCPPYSDAGFRIKIKNESNDAWNTLDDLIVNFNDGWMELSYDISSYAGKKVMVKVESYAGGELPYCSEWAVVDYLLVKDSTGVVLNPNPYFDNGWQRVIKQLSNWGYSPFLVMDFSGYESKIEIFADYFLDFTEGMHIYIPVSLSFNTIEETYTQAAAIAQSNDKLFFATVAPGFNNTEVSTPGLVVDREEGEYYNTLWEIAKESSPDGYVITSFNEWHEGTEIEPSLEYGYDYIELTKNHIKTQSTDYSFPFILCIVAFGGGCIVFVRRRRK